MTTAPALTTHPRRSLYSALILVLLALALALQAGFVYGLATGRGGLSARPRLGGISAPASLAAAPCVSL